MKTPDELTAEALAAELTELRRLQDIRAKRIERGANLTPFINWRIWRAERRVNLMVLWTK